MILRNHERQPSFLRQAVEKLSFIFKKVYSAPSGHTITMEQRPGIGVLLHV